MHLDAKSCHWRVRFKALVPSDQQIQASFLAVDPLTGLRYRRTRTSPAEGEGTGLLVLISTLGAGFCLLLSSTWTAIC